MRTAQRFKQGAALRGYGKIISGQCNVVLGTRDGSLCASENVSLISVMQEHSSSYRTEEGLRFNARDIAVMRGYLEKAAVVLSSVCPSIESVYNSKRSKYTLIRPDIYSQRPKIRILNMRNERQPAPNLSKTVINEALSAIKRTKNNVCDKQERLFHAHVQGMRPHRDMRQMQHSAYVL